MKRNTFLIIVISALLTSAGLASQADGPYMLVKAPAGQYKMEATLNGRTVTKQVTVNARGTANPVVVFPQGTD